MYDCKNYDIIMLLIKKIKIKFIFLLNKSNSEMAAKAISIIDDEVDLVNLFYEACKNNGFKVCRFTDSIEAFNYIKRNPND